MNHVLSLLRPGLAAVAFGASLLAQGFDSTHVIEAGRTSQYPRRTELRPHGDGPIADRLQREASDVPDRLVFDQPGDGRIWALGATYKASFGADGFVYVPFFGSAAPQNYPVQFVLRSVRVGGQDLPFAAAATATRNETRVTFDRGPVREIYDLTARSVEQTFVVDGELAGDVAVELELVSELAEDPTRAGLQFGNHLGQVDYGTAYLVRGTDKQEIPAAMTGRTLRLSVPAAQRGAGPVVIDPVITTKALTATLMNSWVPDVAYDATTDRWGVTWVHIFSQTDHDVVAELRTSNGDPIAGSFKAIDPTNLSHSWPRVANLNSADQFLIAMERFVPSNPVNQQYTVWGRTLNATAPFDTSTLFEISPPSTMNQNSVDVGGDPGTGSRWTVVWVHGSDIHARQVSVGGVLSPNTIPIESTTSACINPQISLSNGNGLTATPAWCIVYNLLTSANTWDVYGAVLDPNGAVIRPHRAIANTVDNDLYTYVSSPLTDVGSNPVFLVSYERQVATPEMVVKVVDTNLNIVVGETNLTRRFGFSGLYTRVESDGARFAATCRIGSSIRAGTLALVGGDLALHEALQEVGNGVSPCIASKRSGGGGNTDYGIGFNYESSTPWRAYLGLYQGRAPAGGFSWRSIGCGLNLNTSGRPFLGELVQFSISNPGSGPTGMLVGIPGPALPLCVNCSVGLDLAGPVIPFPAPLGLQLPRDPRYVGGTLSVQAFAIGSGTCLGGLRLSDTVDFTIQ